MFCYKINCYWSTCRKFPGCFVKTFFFFFTACAFSGLSTRIPCLFYDVLLDLLEVHIHTPFLTMQKGITGCKICQLN